MTPLAASYRAALSTAARDALLRRRRPQSLPARTLLVHDHVIGEDLMVAYAGLFPGAGPLDPADLPSVLVHIAGFPAAMDLMAQARAAMPFLKPSAPIEAPRLTLDAYASLCAELAVAPENRAEEETGAEGEESGSGAVSPRRRRRSGPSR